MKCPRESIPELSVVDVIDIASSTDGERRDIWVVEPVQAICDRVNKALNQRLKT